jgi:anti-sigma factor RsiW
VLTCYVNRRRLGAYLDRALPEGEAQAVAAHLDCCPACRSEAQDLEHVRSLVGQSVTRAEPDWTDFWPGIVRGIGDRRPNARDRRLRVLTSRRLALAGALAASLLAVVVWRGGESPPMTERGSVVDVADTEHPGGSVMVYAPEGGDMTVIWVFGLDNPGPSAI